MERRIIRKDTTLSESSSDTSSLASLALEASSGANTEPPAAPVASTPMEEQVPATPKYAPVEDSAFDAKVNIPKTAIEAELEIAGEELVAYISKNIKYMNDKLHFNGATPPSMYEIDLALATYEQTLFSITAMYEQARFDADTAKAVYDEWYYGKYMEVRNKYNTKDVKNASWLSAKEIDATVFSVYKKEASQLKAQVIKTDGERSTMERLMKAWENYQFILANLKKSVIAQMGASNLTVDLRRGDELDL